MDSIPTTPRSASVKESHQPQPPCSAPVQPLGVPEAWGALLSSLGTPFSPGSQIPLKVSSQSSWPPPLAAATPKRCVFFGNARVRSPCSLSTSYFFLCNSSIPQGLDSRCYICTQTMLVATDPGIVFLIPLRRFYTNDPASISNSRGSRVNYLLAPTQSSSYINPLVDKTVLPHARTPR